MTKAGLEEQEAFWIDKLNSAETDEEWNIAYEKLALIQCVLYAVMQKESQKVAAIGGW